MRDLYAKLGISQEASLEEVAEALKSKPGMAACAPILLNSKKRAVYDRTYTTLKNIGYLRHRLGLDKGDSQFLRDYPDFAPRLVTNLNSNQRHEPAGTALPDQTDSASGQHGNLEPKKKVLAKYTRTVLVAVVGLVLVSLLIRYFLNG